MGSVEFVAVITGGTITLVGVIITAYFGYLGVKESRRGLEDSKADFGVLKESIEAVRELTVQHSNRSDTRMTDMSQRITGLDQRVNHMENQLRTRRRRRFR